VRFGIELVVDLCLAKIRSANLARFILSGVIKNQNGTSVLWRAVIWVGSWIRGSAQRHSTAAGVRTQHLEIGVQRMNYRVRQLLRRTKRKIVRRSLLQRDIANISS
jgi:hypothetical protein